LKIAIIIPTFNRADLIRETLDSVKLQTSPHWECIVVDDGSMDGTDKIVFEYCSIDSRFVLIKRDRSPKGAPTCRNIGLKLAKGEFSIFVDSDDLLPPDRIEKTIEFLSKNLEIDGYIFKIESFKESQAKYLMRDPNDFSDDLLGFLLGKGPWYNGCAAWKTTFIQGIGGWREDLPKGQDWEFHIRILLHKPKIVKSQFTGYYYRIEDTHVRISHQKPDFEFRKKYIDAVIDLSLIAKKNNIQKLYINKIFNRLFFGFRQLVLMGQTKSAIQLLLELYKSRRINSLLVLVGLVDILKTRILFRLSAFIRNIADKPLPGF
jgi:glycosyltransferase involved in cell wall biosynthesis